jgi:hypothetical protein
MLQIDDVGECNGEMALWSDGKQLSHLGEVLGCGKWVIKNSMQGQEGDGVRWNRAKGDREYVNM